MPESQSNETLTEAVAVFHDGAQLQDAVDELLSSGFNQAELSLLASEDAVEEKEYEQPFIAIIEPQQRIADKLSNILDGQFVMLTFPSIDALNEHELERKPNMIITEAEFDNLDFMDSVEAIVQQFNPEKTAIVIHTAKENLESLIMKNK